ncbi:hypothetical protein glysoja_048099 [Glycine soja]|uniref:Uncharacterized protein n=1 Tax=Glycine soja TaxID=3848 RepID=A0A0B2SRM1_GLYSO|nr:hypothetical protein glysoja_048099 [Glycine soja]
MDKLSEMERDLNKAQKDAGGLDDRATKLETMLSLAQLDAKEFDEKASEAEIEAKILRQELGQLEAQKDVGFLIYKQCVENISVLEAKITLVEENSRMLSEQLEKMNWKLKH